MASEVVSDLQVEVGQVKTIVPAEHVEDSTLFLCNIDQEAMYKVESVYFYAPDPLNPTENVAQVVESALSKILVPYYFLAGRFRLNQEEQRLELDCNGAGVLFAAASSKLKLSELGDLSVPNPAFRSLLLQPSDSLGLLETPTATYQVTKFACGGFVFGMTVFHSIFDGVSITDFFRNLGSTARGEGLLTIPNPDRQFLKARNPPKPQYYEQLMCKSFGVSTFPEIPLLPFNPTLSSVNNFAPVKNVFKTFPLSNQMITDLKAESMKDGSLKKCSSFEAVTAHVLQQLARSRSSSLDPQTLMSVFIAVDFRHKLDPPPPKDFCGNAVVTACISAKVEELCTNSLSLVATKVQQALNDVNDEYVRSWTDFWQVNRIGPARIPVGACLSGWWKLPFHELDFGWGKPVYAGPVPNQLVGFIVLLANGKNDGGAYVYLSLEPSEMEAFEKHFYSPFA